MNNITKNQFISIVKSAFLFIHNFPSIKDLIAKLDSDKQMQIHYYNYFCTALSFFHNRSELALLSLYFNFDKEHAERFALFIADYYGYKFQ